jgi:Zn-dependent protease/CBS domain-containing protein
MKNGFRLGKIFGIDIDIDWSWLLIFALVSWSLASSLGQAHPDWAAFMQWGVALAAALLFFASILAHELAHALAARAMNVSVRNIILFMFGGVSNIQREPRSPFGEFVIAIVGPLTSIILGVIFMALGLGSVALNNLRLMDPISALSQIGPVGTIFVWLGSINVLIALFNLIPGFPLDGGRIVRSALWAVTGNLKKATRWASWMGQAVAWILIFAGISMLFGAYVPVLGSGFVNGIWIMFIGWFLQNAAVQSYRRIVVEDILEDVSVKQMMDTDVPMVKASSSVQTLIDNYLMKTNHRAFVVSDDDKVVGLVTIDDIRKVKAEARSQTIIRSIMTPSEKLIVIAPEEGASDALQRLQSEDIRQLPVVTGDKIVGLLRRKDIVRWLQLQSQFG